MGHESDDVYGLLLIDKKKDDRTHDIVIDTFAQYFQSQKNVINLKTQFYHRKLSTDKTAEEYVSSIHSLAVKCGFSKGLTREDMIKDRLWSRIIDTSLLFCRVATR